MSGFCGGRKTEEAGEAGGTPSEQGENQQQTQPTYGTGPEPNPGHIGGRRALSTQGQAANSRKNNLRLHIQTHTISRATDCNEFHLRTFARKFSSR